MGRSRVGCVPAAGEELEGLGSSWSVGIDLLRDPRGLSGDEFRSDSACPQDSTVLGLGLDNWTGGG